MAQSVQTDLAGGYIRRHGGDNLPALVVARFNLGEPLCVLWSMSVL